MLSRVVRTENIFHRFHFYCLTKNTNLYLYNLYFHYEAVSDTTCRSSQMELWDSFAWARFCELSQGTGSNFFIS